MSLRGVSIALVLVILFISAIAFGKYKGETFVFSLSETRLSGVVSDYFRYGFNNDYPRLYGGLEKELERIDLLKKAGADINTIGLYLARLDKIKENIREMDRYIKYGAENGMYVFLAPAGVGFVETNPNKNAIVDEAYWQAVGKNELSKLTEFLAVRYGDLPNVLFQLTAEPNIPNSEWQVLQEKLAAIVRKYTNNPIIVSTSYYSPYTALPALPFGNILYSTGGYVRKDDNSRVERDTQDILGAENLKREYRVIVAEFGGNYGGNFSSGADLASFKEILNAINREKLSYTVYRLSAAFRGDGLALFDIDNNLTDKGKLFVNSFR